MSEPTRDELQRRFQAAIEALRTTAAHQMHVLAETQEWELVRISMHKSESVLSRKDVVRALLMACAYIERTSAEDETREAGAA